MSINRTARLRPDQLADSPLPLDGQTVRYVLKELLTEAEAHHRRLPPQDVNSEQWLKVYRWLDKQYQIANNLNPYTNEFMDDETVQELRAWERL